MSENTVIAVAPSTTATSKPRPSPVLVASRMGRVTAHKRNGPPQGRAAISGCRHRFVPGRERTVPGTSAGARTYLPAHKNTSARSGAVKSLVYEFVVLDGIDSGILSHIGLLCWIERARGTGSSQEGSGPCPGQAQGLGPTYPTRGLAASARS